MYTGLIMSNLKALVKLILKENNPTRQKIEALKKKWAKEFKENKLPLNSEILNSASKNEREKLLKLLVTKPTRTISGVSIIAIMAKPADCPGKCLYCPKGSQAPQSYTGFEPAAMRARLNDFDPYRQVKNRLDQLNSVGHLTEKNELIIMGGTFPALDWEYQQWFVKRAFDAFNGSDSRTLEEAQRKNETAKYRVIGLTIETRPDFVDVKKLLQLGCTRIELGVQTTYAEILSKLKRGHSIQAVTSATKELKDAGFKVLYHIMPGLPGSNYKKDQNMFKTIFSNEKFKPDMLKIYPTLVISGTKLFDLWKQKKYLPVDEDYMLKLLADVYKICPPWIRIMRVQRDIPAEHIIAGPRKSNLREIVISKLKKSNEIRFREAGHAYLRENKIPENVKINITKYSASGGTEFFIAAEDKKQNILLGFLRLRLNKGKSAFVRELHVFGESVPIGEKGKIQHAGWGKKLLEAAEKICKKSKKSELNIISGIGVREYYKKLGYQLKNYYMSKSIK